jgi:NAD(P)-dependent dehydrogenase (short-subunit alcohol dehydrogenase family)
MTLYECFAADLLCDRTVLVTGGGSGINLAIATGDLLHGRQEIPGGAGDDRVQAAKLLHRPRHCVLKRFGIPHVRDGRADLGAQSAELLRGELQPLGRPPTDADVRTDRRECLNGFRTVLAIDLQGAFHTAQASFQQLKDRRGSILFVSAPQAHLPFDSQAHVGAAKAGVESLMRSLAIEWGPYGIRSNSIVPGPIDGTEGLRRVSEQVGLDTWTASTALGRCGTLEEVAAVAVALSCPLGGFITGARIDLDGGLALCGSGLFNRARSGARAPLL